jgi:hypothetical protein
VLEDARNRGSQANGFQKWTIVCIQGIYGRKSGDTSEENKGPTDQRSEVDLVTEVH